MKSTNFKFSSDHNGPRLVFNSLGLQIFGASMTEAEDHFYEYDLVISLGVGIRPVGYTSTIHNPELAKLLVKTSSVEHMQLAWPDMGVPNISAKWWKALADTLSKLGSNKAKDGKTYKVMLHCFGGHGRTGTALCILYLLCSNPEELLDYDPKNIIGHIRDIYCEKAVENMEQMEYISKMTGYDINKSYSTKKLYKSKDFEPTLFRDKFKDNLLLDRAKDLPLPKKAKDNNRYDGLNPDSRSYSVLCETLQHKLDILNLGYCPGCGEETDWHKRDREAKNKAPKLVKTNKYASGIGTAITEEDIKARKDKKGKKNNDNKN